MPGIRILAALAAVALLSTACSKETGVIADAQSFLDTFDGPKVDGVEATQLKMAQDAEAAGNFPQAAQLYQQLADSYPTKIQYRLDYADAIRRAGDPDAAIAVYDVILGGTPSNVEAKEGKALALMQKGSFDMAEPLLLETKTSGKATWKTFNALGVLAASHQQAEPAKQYFAEATRLSPNNASVLNNSGLALALNKEYDAAVATLTQASGLSAGKPVNRKQIDLNMALVHASAGKLEQAETIARQYYEGAALSNNMGFYAHLAKDDQLAKTYLNMALTQSKTFYQRAWNNLQAVNSAPVVPATANTLDSSPALAAGAAVMPSSAPATAVATPEQAIIIPPQEPAPVSLVPQQQAAPAAPAPIPAAAAPAPAPIIAPSAPAPVAVAPSPVVYPPASQQAVAPAAAAKPVPPSMGYLSMPKSVAAPQPAAPTSAATVIPPLPGGSAPAVVIQPAQAIPAAGGAVTPEQAAVPAYPQAAPVSGMRQPIVLEKEREGTLDSIGNWFGSLLD